MPRAIVFGVNGQDGSYSAEHLLKRGYEVLGIGRQSGSRYIPPQTGYTYRALDLSDTAAVSALLHDWPADHLYHYAAIHGPNNPEYESRWEEMVRVNVLSLHAALEHARLHAPALRIAYANSAKIFGPPNGTMSEGMPRVTTCLYSNTKNSAFDLIVHYRNRHNIAASNLILFNHESPRRTPGFFVAELAACLAQAKADRTYTASFQTLDFFADWSDAEDFADIAIDLVEKSVEGTNVIFASGHTWHARKAVEALFVAHGLDYRNHIMEYKKPALPVGFFQTDPALLVELTGRLPRDDFTTLVSAMANSNIQHPEKAAL